MEESGVWPPLKWPAKVTEVPKEIFVREDIYQEELRRIFWGKEWFPIAHESEIPNVNDFKTCSLGEVPLIVVRDRDGIVRAHFNACTHRGAQLETAPFGNKRMFECPYHRWSFNPNGALVGCPIRPGDAAGFDKANYGLKGPRTELLHGLVFVTLNEEAPSLSEFMTGLEGQLANVMRGDGKLKLLGYHKSLLEANWKTYHDNDAYHAPLLHTAFRLLNWQGGRGKQFANDRGHRGFISEISVPDGKDVLSDPSLIEFRGGNEKDGSCSIHLFPLFVGIRHLDTIGLRFVNPRGVNQTELVYAYFGREEDDAEMLKHRVRQSSNLLGPCGMVSMEDAAVFHRIHIGSRTPGMQEFQKGVTDPYELPRDFNQNDESPNVLSWEYYRKVMGFEKEARV
ncbi:aromatic ring-hydroxylating dioxygenase subunit alpha [Pigmentiphaga sp. GD03639]|uniref:aromatic ring-hydroxylating oxygenase subunit alpha n=1 Tax=Pigmentiphaga sp. GD03639 TaxID=2975354 RepID=UPI00244C377E|nr:aromatic ring-hydroxylating dioxygenase subunit alpha [Pigmentiphaga sp. GD03639]MDH2235040.1 aromatic ring-hydroxylating dioxygenase subunit alpha [Pigmentiphaga sp. GD03639]